ncbi:MAG: hypothetical protein WD689_06130 [Gaiellaceae bacterium]
MVERLRDLTPAAAALLAAVAFVAAVGELPHSLRVTDAKLAEYDGLSHIERELYPTRGFGLNPTLLLRADALMPEDAVFHVVTGPGLLAGHAAAPPFSAYWLLPRRATRDPRRADYILSFGGQIETLDVEVALVEDLGELGQLWRVRG